MGGSEGAVRVPDDFERSTSDGYVAGTAGGGGVPCSRKLLGGKFRDLDVGGDSREGFAGGSSTNVECGSGIRSAFFSHIAVRDLKSGGGSVSVNRAVLPPAGGGQQNSSPISGAVVGSSAAGGYAFAGNSTSYEAEHR